MNRPAKNAVITNTSVKTGDMPAEEDPFLGAIPNRLGNLGRLGLPFACYFLNAPGNADKG